MLDFRPNAYLYDVLARIITRADTDPMNQLLPYNWADTKAAQTAFEMRAPPLLPDCRNYIAKPAAPA